MPCCLLIDTGIHICDLNLRIAGEIVSVDKRGCRVNRGQTHRGLIDGHRVVCTLQATLGVNDEGGAVVPRDLPLVDGDVSRGIVTVSYTHLRAHETDSYLVCRLLLEKKKQQTHKASAKK